MKTNILSRSAGFFGIFLVLAFFACSKSDATAKDNTASPPVTTASPFADVNLRMRDLETKMDHIFTDSLRRAGRWFDQSTLASSVDLREEKDKYVARVYVPHIDTSKVNATIENGALHITAENGRTVNGKLNTERYEQVIDFPKPIQADKMQVDRKQDLVVISVPKTSAATPAVASAATAPPAVSPGVASTDWADTVFNQFQQMENRMDQTFRDVFRNDLTSSASALQLGSAVNVDDQKDKYVVHFYLPDKNLSNVDVKFENGQLDLTGQEQKKTSNQSASGTFESATAGRYEEMITLPGPVNDKEMKVDRKDNAVIVSLPKAGTTG